MGPVDRSNRPRPARWDDPDGAAAGLRQRLRLRPLRSDDEAVVVAAHRVMATADHFPFALGYQLGMPWSRYVERLAAQRCGDQLPTGWVPATFLVAEVDGRIVGRTSIRHRLNDFLAREGGHIGYGVLADHRGRGYATEILRQSLVIARSVGVERVLLVCDEANVASATVIERCGGALESRVTLDDGSPARHYWIN